MNHQSLAVVTVAVVAAVAEAGMYSAKEHYVGVARAMEGVIPTVDYDDP